MVYFSHKGKRKGNKKMYTIYWGRGNEKNEVVFTDYSTAVFCACNNVYRLGSDWAYVVDNETGEIVKEYSKS